MKTTIPLSRLKKCIERPDVTLVYDTDDAFFIAKKGSVEYSQYLVSFELASKDGGKWNGGKSNETEETQYGKDRKE